MHESDTICLLVDLMRKHGLGSWHIRWSRSKREFGRCCWSTKTITLSRPLCEANAIEQVKDTILHEIAHALTPFQYHNGIWKMKCIEIGARPIRCFSWDDVKRATD